MTSVAAGSVLGLVLVAHSASVAYAGPSVLQLAPHRAVYSMNLASSRLGGGVTGASGNMTYKFSDSCDGWTVENNTVLTFAYGDGAPVSTTWDFLTWESKDGLHYRFKVRSTRDGVVSEEIDGTANLDGVGRGGTAKYSLPEPRTMALPKGTLFPTEHTRRLLEVAQKGEHLLARDLFDGTGVEGPFDVNAVIGQGSPANANVATPVSPQVNAELLSAPSWRMQMAFFPLGSPDATPDYEVSLRYYLNGVADEVVQSFGNFSLKGTLQRLEPLPKPDC
jgi:hypothetical protein